MDNKLYNNKNSNKKYNNILMNFINWRNISYYFEIMKKILFYIYIFYKYIIIIDYIYILL